MDSPSTKLARTVASQGRQLSWIANSLVPPVSVSTVSRWCSGEREIPVARIAELASLLAVSEDEISEPEAASAKHQRAGAAQ